MMRLADHMPDLLAASFSGFGYSCARRRTWPRVSGRPQKPPLTEAVTVFYISLARPSPTLSHVMSPQEHALAGLSSAQPGPELLSHMFFDIQTARKECRRGWQRRRRSWSWRCRRREVVR